MKLQEYKAIVAVVQKRMHQTDCMEIMTKEFPRYLRKPCCMDVVVWWTQCGILYRVPHGTLMSIVSQCYQVQY